MAIFLKFDIKIAVTAQAVDAITEEIPSGVVEDEGMDVESEIAIGGSDVVVDGGMICSSDQLSFAPSSQQEVEISTEDQRRSSEKLDRSSPDLWPQNCKIM